jgi:uncharacterized protein YecE (DUF72 family)
LYRQHLPPAVVDECWDRFNHALRPLTEAGKLGAVIVRFPSWFSPRPAAWEELAGLAGRLPGLRAAVELTNPRWYAGDACEQTLSTLEALGLGFVCRDNPGTISPVVAATADIAIVRLPGRSGPGRPVLGEPVLGEPVLGEPVLGEPAPPARGPQPPPPADAGDAWVWERAHAYRYSDIELAEWVPAIRDLASGTSQVHVILDNCWQANAVDNAGTVLGLVAR